MMTILKLLLRWARAYARTVSKDGAWVYAPPLAISASSAIWRAAPPPRIVEVVPPEPEPVHIPTRITDPRIVAARRASLRLIICSETLT